MDYGALIRQLQGALGGKTVRGGSVTLTWSASTSSDSQVVTHGLTGAPTSVQLTPESSPFASGVVITPKCPTRTATTITINAETNSSVSGSVVVDWVAIG